jgi:hypothetical protein
MDFKGLTRPFEVLQKAFKGFDKALTRLSKGRLHKGFKRFFKSPGSLQSHGFS